MSRNKKLDQRNAEDFRTLPRTLRGLGNEEEQTMKSLLTNHDSLPAFLGDGWIALGDGNYRSTNGKRSAG